MTSTDHRPRVAAERRSKMRMRLLTSALQLTATKGPLETTIDDVVKLAEVSRGTFYKYFSSPQELVQALATEVSNQLIRLAESQVVKDTDPAIRVANGLRLVSRLAVRHPLIANFLVRLGWPTVLGPDISLKYVQRDIDEGVRIGRFKRLPPPLAVNVVTTSVIASAHAMLLSNCDGDFPEQAAAAVLRALGLSDEEAQTAAFAPLMGIEELAAQGWSSELADLPD
ncbi:TetR/AcrR family transcriptional regulator [Roseateles chitinivorans]|uniref:TetR/AcrR family transcriptional regulator n=1 Tax=Roseateles chitinivorans TaxID=2917965 RepID=UPI003D676455